jgi:type VI protein secretion system component VasK
LEVWISLLTGGKVAPGMKQVWKTCVRILIGLTVASLTIWYTVLRLLDRGHPLEPINLWLIAITIICLVLLAYPEIFSRLQRN